jgi:hypothetical protein
LIHAWNDDEKAPYDSFRQLRITKLGEARIFIDDNKPELLYMNFDNNWLDPNKQKESLDTSFLSKKEDNLVKPFTLEEKQLSDEESIINLTKFKSEKNNEVINKLGVIIRRLNKTNLNTNEKISYT